jgi:hypothetical protein
MGFTLRGTGERLQVAGIKYACEWVGTSEAFKYFVRRVLYTSIRPVDLRVAFAATLVSRKRFETCVIAPKTSSERIVSSGASKINLASSIALIALLHSQCQSAANGISGDLLN